LCTKQLPEEDACGNNWRGTMVLKKKEREREHKVKGGEGGGSQSLIPLDATFYLYNK